MIRRRHIIGRNHQTAAPTRYIFVDTEALNENGKPESGVQTLWFGCAIFAEIRGDREGNREVRKQFDTSGEYWDWVESLCVSSKPITMFAHNMGYDASILAAESELTSRGWKCTRYINPTGGPLIVHWVKNPPRGYRLIMLDSMNYFSSSLAELGEATGLSKLDPAALRGDLAGAVDYCWRDVEILKAAVLAFRAFVVDNDLGNLRPTIAGQAMTSYRHRFMSHKILCHTDYPTLALERASLHGGRTEAFIDGEVPADHGRLYKLDVNSFYPSIMRDNVFSARLITRWPRYYPHSFNAALAEGRGIVANVYLNTDAPIYGVVFCVHCEAIAAECICGKFRGDKLIFPIGTFWTTLSTPELRFAHERGHIMKVGVWSEYSTEPLFSGYVDWFYHKRLEYRREGNAAFAHMSKTMLNSLFGRFAMRSRRWEYTNNYSLDDIRGVDKTRRLVGESWTDSGPGTDTIKLRERIGRVQLERVDPESSESVPIISSEITGYARIKLWEYIEIAGQGEGRVYYCDTDSLVVNQAGYDNLVDYIHPTDLGMLDIEGISNYAEFRAPKHYSFQHIDGPLDVKIKGVRKSAVLWSDIETREIHACQPQFRSWDVNLALGIDGQVTVKDIIKKVSGLNTKRISRGRGQFNDPIRLDL